MCDWLCESGPLMAVRLTRHKWPGKIPSHSEGISEGKNLMENPGHITQNPKISVDKCWLNPKCIVGFKLSTIANRRAQKVVDRFCGTHLPTYGAIVDLRSQSEGGCCVHLVAISNPNSPSRNDFSGDCTFSPNNPWSEEKASAQVLFRPAQGQSKANSTAGCTDSEQPPYVDGGLQGG